jgi:hypothetical protein
VGMTNPKAVQQGQSPAIGGTRRTLHPSDDGSVIKVVKMGCHSAAGLIVEESAVARSCEPPAPQACFPPARALRNPVRLRVLRRRAGKHSAREIREYSSPTRATGRSTTDTGKHSIA